MDNKFEEILNEKKEKIIKFMTQPKYKPMTLKEIAALFGVPKSDKELFQKLVFELEEEGKIFKSNNNRYGITEKMNLIVGKLQGNERGFGFLIPDNEDIKDVFISLDSMNGAMHKDRIIARIIGKPSKSGKIEGEVVKIISRENNNIVGTFEKSKNYGFVISDDLRISGDIFIPKNESNYAKTGQKVVAEIVKWPDKRRNAEGRIIEILGNKDDVGVDIISILKAYDLNETFPEAVLKKVETISDTVPESEKNRRDLRNVKMVTIDGEDAKDLDDAVSVERRPDGSFLLGVHIADVSHM